MVRADTETIHSDDRADELRAEMLQKWPGQCFAIVDGRLFHAASPEYLFEQIEAQGIDRRRAWIEYAATPPHIVL